MNIKCDDMSIMSNVEGTLVRPTEVAKQQDTLDLTSFA